MDLTRYRTLGRSGLGVSPISLGTMTFGQREWGADEATSRAIFDRYVGAGGNFLDTANIYGGGASETILGEFLADPALRDRMVLATKGGLATGESPNAAGLGAKSIVTALEASLRRLRTDYVDLYWLHLWDWRTPMEELAETMAGLVRSGKIRYWGVCNTPAWIVARLGTIAALLGKPGPIGLQYEYSLIERSVEADLIPLAEEMGMGLVPWSPLGGGFLTGKYRRDEQRNDRPLSDERDARLNSEQALTNTAFTDRNWAIADRVAEVASEVEATPAAVSIAWSLAQKSVTAPIVGIRRPDQFDSVLEAMSLRLAPEMLQRLDQATTPVLTYPATLYSAAALRRARGSLVESWLDQRSG